MSTQGQEGALAPLRSLLSAAILVSLFHQHAFGLHFVSLGDWGDNFQTGIYQQNAVAEAMSDWCGSHDCLFIISTGDNIYPVGVTSATDSRFDTSWRWIYNLTNIDSKLWYISVGNHDHGEIEDGRELYQVEFGNTEPSWYFPSLWYDVHYTDGVTRLHLIVIDSESLKENKYDPAAQLSWLESTLAGSVDDWKILIDHHPPYSAGDHGPTEPYIAEQVVPLCLQYGVNIFLSGHDHCLQHITSVNDTAIDYIVSGGGGRSLNRKHLENEEHLNGIGFRVDYYGFQHGFVAFDLSPTSYTAHFVDKDLNVTYSYDRSK